MNYCSNCGSKNISFQIPKGDNRSRWTCNECETIHYDNPRIIVGCLIVENNEIMLCRRGIEPRKGLWNLPAGFLENGESAEEGAVRETLEETRAQVSIESLHAVYSLPKTNQVYLHFRATMVNDHYEETEESTEIKFFAPNEIPWSEIAFSSTAFAIEKYLEHPQGKEVHIGSYRGAFY